MNHPLHLEALQLVGHIKSSQNRLIEVLIENERIGLYKQLKQPSLFVYCMKALGLTESCTYELISVTRKAGKFSSLRRALKEKKISVPKAARIVSALTKDNAEEIVSFASNHTLAETADKLSAKGFARAKKVSFSAETLKKIKRVAEVTGLKTDEAVAKACDEFLFRHDRLLKAQRAEARKNRKLAVSKTPHPKVSATAVRQAFASRVTLESRVQPSNESKTKPSRAPIPVAISHAVYLRDQGQCTIRDHKGERCPNRAFLETHHLVQVQHGGGNDVDNLTLVCWNHHDLIHQEQLPFVDATDWSEILLRSLGSASDPALLGHVGS